MHFIFPKNYNFRGKLLGLIDYWSAIINLIWSVFVFFVLYIMPIPFTTKLFVFVLLCFPLILIGILNFNNETIIYIFSYVFKYLKNQKLYLYNK